MLAFKKWFLETTRLSPSFADDELMPVDTRTIGALPFYSKEDRPETLKKDPRIRKRKVEKKYNLPNNCPVKNFDLPQVRMELGNDT